MSANEVNEIFLTNNESKKKDENYSFKYRVIKTFFLCVAYVSVGLNIEIFGVTVEDLRILLKLDYKQVSNFITTRTLSYIASVTLIGFTIDKFLKYSDLLIALGCMCLAIRRLNRKTLVSP
jgi:hypothetical protein